MNMRLSASLSAPSVAPPGERVTTAVVGPSAPKITSLAVAALAGALILSGCATATDGLMLKKDVSLRGNQLDAIQTPIRAAHEKAPVLQTPTVGGVVLQTVGVLTGGLVGVGLVVGGIHGVNQATRETQTQVSRDCVVTDPGYELSARFAEMWNGQGRLPKIVPVESPIQPKQRVPGAAITFTTPYWLLTIDHYLAINSNVVIKDDRGNVIFKASLGTNGRLLEHEKHTKEEFLANNCQLLIQEMDTQTRFLAAELVKKLNLQTGRNN